MIYCNPPVKKLRTIETLEIFDIMEIVMRDLARYGVPDGEVANFLIEYVMPLHRESESLKSKYTNK